MKKLILLLMTVVCFSLAQAQTVSQSRWYNSQLGYVYRGLSYYTTDTNLIKQTIQIQNYDTNLYSVLWIKNNTANDFVAGDSITVAFSINGIQIATRTLKLTSTLQKDSSKYFFLNEYLLVNGASQWGVNNYCYKVIARNTTPVTDTATANCMTFSFYKKAVYVSNAKWYNLTDSTITNNLSYSCYEEDSILIKYTATVSNFQPNYNAKVWLTNTTGADMAIGDSLKVATYINGNLITTRTISLPFVFKNTATINFTANEYVVAPNICNWGPNNITYKIVECNGTSTPDFSTDNSITFTFNKINTPQDLTIADARWYDTITKIGSTGLTYTTSDDSLLNRNIVSIKDLTTNYRSVIWITNNTGADIPAGDSLKVGTFINGNRASTWKISLTKTLMKDSTSNYTIDEHIIVPGLTQWGQNNYCYKVTRHNETPVNDTTTNNCISFTFQKTVKGVKVTNVSWYNKQNNTLSKTHAMYSLDDSLLIKYQRSIQNIDTNYFVAIQITNGTGYNLAAGDSIKVKMTINGSQVLTRKLTLSKALPKDSSIYFFVNEWIILPNSCQWGDNTYCYQVTRYNDTLVSDSSTNNCMTFSFRKTLQGLNVVHVRWYNTQSGGLTTGLTYTSSDDSLLSRNIMHIQSLISNYKSAVWIKNNTGADIPAGDSIRITINQNGTSVTTWKFTLSKALLKDSTTTITLNEYLIVPGLTQWGTNTYCYQVTRHNDTPAYDSTTNNCISFTFQKPIKGLVVSNAAWYNTQNQTITSGLTYTSSDDSLLLRNVVRIQSLASNYKSAVWITNNTNADLAAGDSIKIAIIHNGTQISTWKITLNKALLKDSTTSVTLNEYLIVPGLTLWGTNSYCYKVTKYNDTPVDDTTNQCISFTFQKPLTGLTVTNAEWYDTQNQIVTKGLTYTSSDDSLLLRNVVQIQSLASNYKSAVWITNNTNADLAAGDSIRVAIKHNGSQLTTWKFTLSKALLKDSTTTITLNEYLIVPGITQWGTNSYCYEVTQHNTTPVADTPTNNCISFTFQKPVAGIAVTNVGWFNKQDNTLSKTHAIQTTDDSLLTNPATIQNLDTNYVVVLQITNGTANTLIAGDSIRVRYTINGTQALSRTLTLQNALPKDSSTLFTINEYVILPALCQWGDNTYCYEVTKYNETPVTDSSYNNCMTFTFTKVLPQLTDITVINAGWYDMQNNTLTKSQSMQSTNDSLLTNPATISVIDANYRAAVQIKNGSVRDLSTGDSIKVAISQNGTQVNTWNLTLSNALPKDSATIFFVDEQVIVPGLTQWGSNNYCYEVTYYNETPIADSPTNNCMTFTFENTTGIVENALEEVKIYPNPARNILHINNVNNADINIYSITGQRVKTINNVNGNQDIDVSGLASGIYILKMQDGQNTRVEKIQVVK